MGWPGTRSLRSISRPRACGWTPRATFRCPLVDGAVRRSVRSAGAGRLTPMNVAEKPSLDGLEAKWGEWWEATGTFRFDRTKTRDGIYAIDTPPPTASGSLHIGHVMSYTHTDIVARYQR